MNSSVRFHGSDNKDLVKYLKDTGRLKSDYAFDLMCKVDWKYFTVLSSTPYIDAPLPIGYGKTISAPHMHAMILDKLVDKLQTGRRALVIESRTGYFTVCFALALGSSGFVIGIDSIAQFKTIVMNIIRIYFPLLEKRVELIVGDGKLGCSSKGPYDIIYVGAAASEIPQTLIDQLAMGGRLLMPVGSISKQTLEQIDKNLDGRIERKSLMHVRYGMLTGVDNQKSKPNVETKEQSRSNLNHEQIYQKLEELNTKLDKVYDDRKTLFDQINTRFENTDKTINEKIDNKIKNFSNTNNDMRNEISTNKMKFEELICNLQKTVDRLEENSKEKDSQIELLVEKNNDLEKQLSDEMAKKTESGLNVNSQTSMMNIIEKAFRVQEIMLEQRKIEIEGKNMEFNEMKEKIQSLESNLNCLTKKIDELKSSDNRSTVNYSDLSTNSSDLQLLTTELLMKLVDHREKRNTESVE